MLSGAPRWKVIARVEFYGDRTGDEVTMRLTYHFPDGSIDDEATQ